MSNEQISAPPRVNRIITGSVLTAAGGILLLKQFGFFFPAWLTSWPMIPLLVGLTIGLMSRFRNPGWVFPFGIGVIFLSDRIFPGADLYRLVAPAFLIGIGLWVIFGRNRPWKGPAGNQYWKTFKATTHASGTEYVNVTSVFSGIEKKVLSKNFVGGEVVAIMGGMELDLSQADIQGRVRLEVTNIMGGTKLIVPSHWQIISEMASVFGGIEDKRMMPSASPDTEKVLVIEGTSVMGGIEIHSYT